MGQLGITALALAMTTAGATSKVQQQASIFGLVAETATFSDAHDTLGPAEVRHNGGDAAASAYFACYIGPDGTALVLKSDSEMGGGKTITSFQLLEDVNLADFSGFKGFTPSPSARPKCARAAKLTRGTSTGGGLRLGMTRAEIVGVLHQDPVRRTHSALFFVIEDPERPVRESDGGVIGNPNAWLKIGFKRDRVASVRVTYSSAI